MSFFLFGKGQLTFLKTGAMMRCPDAKNYCCFEDLGAMLKAELLGSDLILRVVETGSPSLRICVCHLF